MVGEGTQGLFPGAENMVSDKSRSVGPRSTRTENSCTSMGSPWSSPSWYKETRSALRRLAPQEGLPTAPARAAMSSMPLHSMESRASLEYHPRSQQGYARTMQGTPSLSRVLWTSAPYPMGIPARAQEIGLRHSFWKGTRLVQKDINVKPQNKCSSSKVSNVGTDKSTGRLTPVEGSWGRVQGQARDWGTVFLKGCYGAATEEMRELKQRGCWLSPAWSDSLEFTIEVNRPLESSCSPDKAPRSMQAFQ